MTWFEIIILGVVQGLTEFLPVSSSGHLRIVSAVLFDRDAGASFTAVTQLGTEAAVLIFFVKDIARLMRAWLVGVFNGDARDNLDYRLSWYVIFGTLPVGLLGFVFKDQIRTAARNLWLIAISLIVFALVLGAAELWGRRRRSLEDFRLRDGLIMGCAQALALIPGVSRSGSTISAGLFLGLTREVATRYSFLLAIPAVLASGLFSVPDVFDRTGNAPTVAQMIVATLIAFVIGYACIAWLLRFVVAHSVYVFVWYRIVLGLFVIVLLATGVLQAT
jgi:undecaprenyl-diphosphatase